MKIEEYFSRYTESSDNYLTLYRLTDKCDDGSMINESLIEIEDKGFSWD